jgi:RNA polymerase sigma-70 factor (ECF subfamily)
MQAPRPAEPLRWIPGDRQAFGICYRELFRPLYIYAFSMLGDELSAEEAVQVVFLKLWEMGNRAEIGTSLKAYLYRAVHNACLNEIRHRQVKEVYRKHVTQGSTEAHHETPDHAAHYRSLEEAVRRSLSELPEQCRTVFQLSRFEQHRYREIAQRLGISEKTVENHIAKALRLLRQKLAGFMTLLATLSLHLQLPGL